MVYSFTTTAGSLDSLFVDELLQAGSSKIIHNKAAMNGKAFVFIVVFPFVILTHKV